MLPIKLPSRPYFIVVWDFFLRDEPPLPEEKHMLPENIRFIFFQKICPRNGFPELAWGRNPWRAPAHTLCLHPKLFFFSQLRDAVPGRHKVKCIYATCFHIVVIMGSFANIPCMQVGLYSCTFATRVKTVVVVISMLHLLNFHAFQRIKFQSYNHILLHITPCSASLNVCAKGS